MEKQQYEIACGRCGEIRLEFLTEREGRVTSDGIGPAYRPCERCRKVTGWIKARSRRTPAAEAGLDMAQRPLSSTQNAERLVPSGQERIPTSSESDEANSILQSSDGL
jgi:hypothetical protein